MTCIVRRMFSLPFFTHDVLLLLSVLRAPYIFHPRTETVAYHYEIFRFALKVEMNFIYVPSPYPFVQQCLVLSVSFSKKKVEKFLSH